MFSIMSVLFPLFLARMLTIAGACDGQYTTCVNRLLHSPAEDPGNVYSTR
jgi:hypothetical protein